MVTTKTDEPVDGDIKSGGSQPTGEKAEDGATAKPNGEAIPSTVNPDGPAIPKEGRNETNTEVKEEAAPPQQGEENKQAQTEAVVGQGATPSGNEEHSDPVEGKPQVEEESSKPAEESSEPMEEMKEKSGEPLEGQPAKEQSSEPEERSSRPSEEVSSQPTEEQSSEPTQHEDSRTVKQ